MLFRVIHTSDIMVKFAASEDMVVHGPGKVTDRVAEKEKEVIELLLVDPGYTYGDMAEILKVSRKTISERIKALKEKGVIERVGSDTKGYWKII